MNHDVCWVVLHVLQVMCTVPNMSVRLLGATWCCAVAAHSRNPWDSLDRGLTTALLLLDTHSVGARVM